MLFEAAFWRPDEAQPSRAEALSHPRLARYVEDWGRPSDAGLIALDAEAHPIGAAWYRFFTSAEPGYGYVASSVPELALAVSAEHRRQGVGDALLGALLERARTEELAGVSLSVEADNPALALYRRHGFDTQRADGGFLTMVVRLSSGEMHGC